MAWEDPITEAQIEYIEILTHDEEDEQIIQRFLKRVNKPLNELNRREAHNLIQRLLTRPAEYTFVCGLKAKVSKQDYNKFKLFGELEACLHACPKMIDVHECKPYNKYHMEEMDYDWWILNHEHCNALEELVERCGGVWEGTFTELLDAIEGCKDECHCEHPHDTFDELIEQYGGLERVPTELLDAIDDEEKCHLSFTRFRRGATPYYRIERREGEA